MSTSKLAAVTMIGRYSLPSGVWIVIIIINTINVINITVSSWYPIQSSVYNTVMWAGGALNSISKVPLEPKSV